MKKALLALAFVLTAGLTAWGLWPAESPPAAAPSPAAAAKSPKPAPRSVAELLAQVPFGLTMPDAEASVVRGRVLDEEGRPVAGAEVDALPLSDAPSLVAASCDECGMPLLQCASLDTAAQVAEALRQARGESVPLASTRSDAEGKYVLPLQWEGTVILRARDGQARAAAEELDAFGEDVELDLTVQPPVAVHGSVHDESGAAVAGARVILVSTHDGAHAEAVAGADGTFAVRCPGEPCALWTFAQAPGYAPSVQTHHGVLSAEDNRLEIELMRARSLEVLTRLAGRPVDATVVAFLDGHRRTLHAAGGVARLDNLGLYDVTLEASASGFTTGERVVGLDQVHNKVVLELRASARALVEVLGPDGHPVADAMVSLDGPDARASAQSTPDGALVVLGPVGEGTYELSVEGPEGLTRTQQVDLKPGDNPFSVTLSAARFISGKVIDPEGKPAPVTLVLASFGGQLERATADAETGEFRLAVAEAGPWNLVADSPHAGRARLSVAAPASDVVLRFDRRAGILVEVSAEGRPGADVMVAVTPEDRLRPAGRARALALQREAPMELASRPMSGVTDDEGRLAIWGLEPGAVEVRVADAAFRPVVKKVTLVEGQQVKVRIPLEPGATVEGVVVDAAGAPVEGADITVVLADAAGEHGLIGRAVEEGGRFKVAGLDPGKRYALTADTEVAASPRVEVQAPARGVRLVVEALPKKRGRVLDAAGAPVAEFEIDGRRFEAADGRFEVAVMRAQAVTMFVSAAGFITRVLELEAGQEPGEVVLQRALKLHGRVVSARGEPVPGARVSCDVCVETTTGADGAFELSLDDENLHLVVRASRAGQSGVAEVIGPGEVLVRLGPKTRVDGRSYDLEGRPAPGPVVAELADGSGLERAVADAQGRFTLELDRGQWTFQTASGDFETSALVGEVPVQVNLGGVPGTCALSVTVPRDREVRVVATSRAEEPATVMLQDVSAGELRFAGMPCGPYQVTAYFLAGGGEAARRVDLELKPPLTRHAFLDLSGGAENPGQVGQPVPGGPEK